MSEAMDRFKEELLAIDGVEAVDDGSSPGYMGPQVQILLNRVDDFNFSVSVEDINLNCAWCIVDLRSGAYKTGRFGDRANDDDTLVATIEVTRLPE